MLRGRNCPKWRNLSCISFILWQCFIFYFGEAVDGLKNVCERWMVSFWKFRITSWATLHSRCMLLKIKAYHNVVRWKYRLSAGILGKRTASLRLEKRASGSHNSFFRLGSQNSFSEKLHISGLTTALFSHLTKLVFKLSNSLTLFKWTALRKGRARTGCAFMLLRQLGKRANVFGENWTFTLYFSKSYWSWVLNRSKQV